MKHVCDDKCVHTFYPCSACGEYIHGKSDHKCSVTTCRFCGETWRDAHVCGANLKPKAKS